LAQDNDERDQKEGAETFHNGCEAEISASHSELSFDAVTVELEGLFWRAEKKGGVTEHDEKQFVVASPVYRRKGSKPLGSAGLFCRGHVDRRPQLSA